MSTETLEDCLSEHFCGSLITAFSYAVWSCHTYVIN